ncbi:DUF1877 family protein [Streptomyces sp. TRM68367]|uniref:DUF1877 family protein n=1 Tax=Streptomyces sp. TRM68367 TaxID=2758415 RepID=UPI00165ADC60|nr:DUF1877 family protein [Streptomyces sp. TRM68367]MBC9729124.1 DUF1877 family protein [Streptomyces sp. TRM68367]
MTPYFHLRAVPPSALRNSTTWLHRLFQDDWTTVRERIGRHREEVLDPGYLRYELLYTGGPCPHPAGQDTGADVVRGGRPVDPPDPDEPPFLLLTAAQVTQVAAFLTSADFDSLWRRARDEVLPQYGGEDAEPEARGVFAATHRDLTAFYAQTAHYGDAVVKWLVS